MNNRRVAALAATVVATGAAAVVLGPIAQAATYNPCSALNHGKLRYSVGGSKHVVFALSSGYSSNYVVVSECAKKGGTWKRVSVTKGRAGTKGFAKPGAKREGDGKSPTGVFTLTEAFGMKNPGTKLPYRTLRSSGDCWGSTPGKSHYNAYYSGTCRSTDEDLSATMRRGPYRQAVVIDYNRPKVVQGAGSAIFFHVGGKTATAGCIAISETKLKSVMRTLVAGDRMVMGPKSALIKS